MEKLDNQALTRFERLWKIEGDKLLRANIIPSAVKDGEIYPVDYCISTIARLIQQPHGAKVVCGIRNALSELFEAADTQFIDPDESLHVSLLGCYTLLTRLPIVCHLFTRLFHSCGMWNWEQSNMLYG